MLILISLVSIVKCLQNATTPAILIMNSWDNNVPVIADYNGYKPTQTNRNHGFYADPCGQLYIFGGTGPSIRQISRVEGCQLKEMQLQLPFDFEAGSCAGVTGTKGQAGLLCFGDKRAERCHAFDGKSITSVQAVTNYSHRNVRLTTYRGMPFTVGSNNPDHVKTEIMYEFNNTAVWKTQSDYHFLNRIYTYAIIPVNQSVIVFGGCCEDINYLPYLGKWNKIGELKSGRYGHSVTALDNTLLVIGGLIEDGDQKVNSPSPTEKWHIDPKHLVYNSTNVEPALKNYYFWPLVFDVPFDYCQ